MVPTVVSVLVSLMTDGVGHLSSTDGVGHLSSSVQCAFKSFAHIFNWIFLSINK